MSSKTWPTTLVGTVSLLAAYSLLPTDSAWSAETAAVLPAEHADFAQKQATVNKVISAVPNLLPTKLESAVTNKITTKQNSIEKVANENPKIVSLPHTSEEVTNTTIIVQDEVESPLEDSVTTLPETNYSESISVTKNPKLDQSIETQPSTTDTAIANQAMLEANNAGSDEPSPSLERILATMEKPHVRKAAARRLRASRQETANSENSDLGQYLTRRPYRQVLRNQSENESSSSDSRVVEPQQYRIQSGDTLQELAERFNLSVETLVQANDIDNPDLILTEQHLTIPTDAIIETTNNNLSRQETDWQPIDNVQAVSPNRNNDTFARGGSWKNRQVEVAATLSPTDEEQAILNYVWPTHGTLTSGYGWRWGRMHRGVDIAAPIGTPVIASSVGTVEFAGWNDGGYGNLVEIRHPDGSLTRYAHNSELLVARGQSVLQGQVIAKIGSTGYSTGPHLHFEIHQPNQGAVNPMEYLAAANL